MKHNFDYQLFICKKCCITKKDFENFITCPIVHKCEPLKLTSEKSVNGRNVKYKAPLMERANLRKIFLHLELKNWAKNKMKEGELNV